MSTDLRRILVVLGAMLAYTTAVVIVIAIIPWLRTVLRPGGGGVPVRVRDERVEARDRSGTGTRL